MSELYFDSNVYSQVDLEASANEVRGWASGSGSRVRVSENIMSEAFRIPDADIRRRRFESITRLASVFPQPGAFLTMRELVDAVQRYRPHWLRKDPDLEFVSRFLNLDRNTWRRLRADPGHYPDGIERSLAMVHFAAGDVRQRQRKTKMRLSGTAANMVAALPTDGAESAWRTGAALQLIDSLFPDQQTKAWSGLTFAYLDARQITPQDLASFFQDEVLDDELPRTRLMGVTDYLQRRYELTAGNWTDQGHAVEILNGRICHA